MRTRSPGGLACPRAARALCTATSDHASTRSTSLTTALYAPFPVDYRGRQCLYPKPTSTWPRPSSWCAVHFIPAPMQAPRPCAHASAAISDSDLSTIVASRRLASMMPSLAVCILGRLRAFLVALLAARCAQGAMALACSLAAIGADASAASSASVPPARGRGRCLRWCHHGAGLWACKRAIEWLDQCT
jgi:hypothetical protein